MTKSTAKAAWPRVPLSECCDIVSGSTPRRDRPEYWGGSIAWATPKDLSGLDVAILSDTPEKITEDGYKSCSTTMMPKGAVLFSSRAPIGLLAIAGRAMCTNQGFKSLVPGPDLDSAFLYWCLRRLTPRIAQRGVGTTFKELSRTSMARVEIPVPPLPEQRRIAAILDKADAIRRKRRESIKLLEEFLRSAFMEMFGDPVRNPKGWEMCDVGSAVTEIAAGWSAKSEDREPDHAEWGVLKISSVTSGRFLPSECKVVGNDIGRSVITPSQGDLLFSRANTRELVAATCLVERDAPRRFLPDKLWKITPAVPVRAEYLRYLFGHPGFRARICRQATGTSGSMLNISQKKLRRMQMPNAPSILQDGFASLVWKTYEARRKMEVATEGFDQLFDSLAQRAFRGEL